MQYQKELTYEAMREQTVRLVNIAGKMLKHPITNPSSYMPFPWDKKQRKETVMNRKQMMKYQRNILNIN